MKWARTVWVLAFVVMTSVNVYSGTGEKIMIKNGVKVKMAYTLTVEGRVIDSTEGREPFQYTHGEGELLPGLEKRLEGLSSGDQREIVIGPEDGFSLEDPKAYIEVPKSELPEGDIEVGTSLVMMGQDRRRVPVTVAGIKPDTVLLNMNHPLAGKELHFSIEILEVA